MKRRKAKVTRKWQPNAATSAFLAALRVCPSITRAAEAAGVSRELHYRNMARVKAYKPLFEAAYAQGVDALEDKAVERAHYGVKRLRLYHGQPVMVPVDWRVPDGPKEPLYDYEVPETIVATVLRANKPDKYKERVQAEVSGKDGGPVSVKVEVEFVKSNPQPEPEDG